MDFIYITFPIAVALALLAAMILLEVAPRWGLVDHPGGRKLHQRQTPLIGGLIIGSAMLATLVVIPKAVWILPLLVLAAATIFIGVLDDLVELSAGFRLLTHMLVGLGMALWAGVQLTSVGALISDAPIILGWLAVPATIFAVAAAKNALNMVDGVDGLAGVLALLPVAVVFYFSAKLDHAALLSISLPLLGGLFVFLALNFPLPWRVNAACFLGDTGSTLLGFLVSWLLIQGAQEHLFRPTLALYLLAVPLIDTAGVMVRRLLHGVSISTAGRDHFHHVLIDAGMSPRHATYVIAALALLIACLGLVLEYREVHEGLMLLLFIVFLLANTLALRSAEKAKFHLRSRFFSYDE
jgi:UDP-GlcNAc:undecaprenyl-phosphate GlcNAc-1-phosphate transferase